jgi:hydroxymethylpyrimidine pyrophosphatase-like HAD family hydrolase
MRNKIIFVILISLMLFLFYERLSSIITEVEQDKIAEKTLKYLAENYNIEEGSQYIVEGVLTDETVLQALNLLRKYENFTYLYSVKWDGKSFYYGVSAFDTTKEWSIGVPEYNVVGEKVDDEINYFRVFREIEKTEKVLKYVQKTEYGYMNSYYIKCSGSYILGIDILRKDSPIIKFNKEVWFIVRFLLLFGILLLIFLSGLNKEVQDNI